LNFLTASYAQGAEIAEFNHFSFAAQRSRLPGGMTGQIQTSYCRPPAKEKQSDVLSKSNNIVPD
jgi:hypothetical protein